MTVLYNSVHTSPVPKSVLEDSAPGIPSQMLELLFFPGPSSCHYPPTHLYYHAQKEKSGCNSSELKDYTARGRIRLLKPDILNCVIAAHISQILKVLHTVKVPQK